MIIILQIQINIFLSVLLIFLLLHAYFTIDRKKPSNLLFLWIMGLTCIILILEIFGVILDNPYLKEFMVLHRLVNVIGFIIAPTIPLLGYAFVKEWVNKDQLEKIKSKKMLLFLYLVNAIAALISYAGSGIFHVTSENIYERGPLFFLSPCISFIYFVYSIYFINKQHKKFTRSEFLFFNFIFIIPVLCTIIQLKYPVYLTIWNSMAVIIVVTYIFILKDHAYRDSLTGLENRLSYEHYAQNIHRKNLNRLSVVYMDLDELKLINDHYGHFAGDEIIKQFADLLVKSFPLKHKKLIRLGGDEFLILLEGQKSEMVAAYIQNLNQHVEAYNSIGEKPYNLKFSYGTACYTNEYKNIYQLLDYADQLMYEQKQSRKSI